MAEGRALVVVDLQNDFTPGGALGVFEGDQVVPPLNQYLERFHAAGLPIFASRDWHPTVTKHFKAYGGLWPPHCVQGTRGAEFHPDLKLPEGTTIVSKGMDPEKDSYSVFDAFEDASTPFIESLRRRGIDHLYIGGLTTDYCVKWTAVEGYRQGLQVTPLVDACLGVNLHPHDSERAIAEMVRQGATLLTLERLRL